MSTPADYFAMFGEKRRPWLDPESLKERFHRLTAEHHPDVNPASDFSAIIAAYNTLSDPKARVRHLLDLEFPGAVSDSLKVPADLQELFMRIAGTQAAFGRVASKLKSVGSPLALALLAEEKAAVCGQLKALLEMLRTRQEEQLEALRALDDQWSEKNQGLAEALSGTAQRLSYLQKWSGQVRECMLSLELP